MRNRIGISLITGLIVMLVSSVTVYAGSINGAEASVISAASGTFAYQGKHYVATASSMGQLKGYLASDDIDLTEDQASRAIALMYENIATGVEGGYIVAIDEESTPNEGDGDGSDKTDNINQDKPEKNDEEPEVDQIEPMEVSPEAKEIFDAMFQINRHENTGDEAVAEPEDEAEAEFEEGYIYPEDIPAEESAGVPMAVWIFVAILTSAVAVVMLKRPRIDTSACGEIERLNLTDIHCHALYGVDDGAKTAEESRLMIEMLKREGVKNIIFTFHAGCTSRGSRIKAAQARVEELQAEFPGMKFYLGNEIMHGSNMQKALVEKHILTLADSSYVLVEFLPGVPYDELLQRVRRLAYGGYRPVIAHAERYGCLFRNIENVQEIIRMGAYVQINCSSFLGSMADVRTRFVLKLLRDGLVHFIADDSHGLTDRKPVMGSLYMYLLKKKGIEKQTLDRVFRDNPEMILRDQAI